MLDGALLVVANASLWLGAHSITGYVAHRLPGRWLARDRGVMRLWGWEDRGRCYERLLRVSKWKDRVPEAGAIFAGGVSKRHLEGRSDGSLARFAAEARRAEIAHWTCLLAIPVAVLWNPLVGVVLMAAYGVIANVPFIVIQRYNRARIIHLLRRRAERRARTGR